MTNYTRTTISLPTTLARKGLSRAAKRGHRSSFSAYVAQLIEEDIESAAHAKEQRRFGRNQGTLPLHN